MLKSMRRSVQSTFVKFFLFGLLIISFGLWGITDLFVSSPETQTVARVDDAELDFPTYANRFQSTLRQTGLLGVDFEINATTGKFIENAVLEPWGLEVAMGKEIAAMRLAVTDTELRDQIQRDPTFRDSSGVFSRQRFESFLSSRRLNEALYLQQLRGSVLQNQLVRTMLSSTPVPPEQAKLLAQYDLTFRDSRMFEVLATPLMSIPVASTADIEAFYDDRQEDFRVDEKRNIEMLSLSLSDIAATVQLDDGAVEQHFAENQDAYSVPERRTVERILFPDEAKSREAWLALQEGQDFVSVAKKFADLSQEAIELGEIMREGFADTALAEQAFRLGVDKVSDPFEGLFGWMIVRTRAIKSAIIPEFSSVKDELEAELRQERATDLVFDYVDQVEDLLAGGATLAEIAADIRLPKLQKVIEMGSDDQDSMLLQSQVASLEEAGDSQMFEDNTGGYRLIELQSIIESRIPALADIRTSVESAWREDQQYALALAQAKTLANRVNNGETLEAVANATGLTLRKTEAVNRDGRQKNPGESVAAFVEAAHIDALFALDAGIAVALPSELGARMLVLGTETVEEGKASSERSTLKSEIASEMFMGFEQALRAKYPIEKNRAALNHVYSYLNGANG